MEYRYAIEHIRFGEDVHQVSWDMGGDGDYVFIQQFVGTRAACEDWCRNRGAVQVSEHIFVLTE